MPLSVTDMIAMIGQLPIAAKHQIHDFLDEELESEEDSLESLAEIQQVYKEYESGDYITFDEYLKKRRHKLNISNSL